MTERIVDVTPNVRVIRSDLLNWTLQVHRDGSTENTRRALAAKGVAETKPKWRDVGYYGSLPQALYALMERYPDLAVEFPPGVVHLLANISSFGKQLLHLASQEHLASLSNRRIDSQPPVGPG